MQVKEDVEGLNKTDEENKDGCPFCYEPPHQFKSQKKEEPPTEVESKPEQLKCDDLTALAPYQYTMARHHLISAIQCYAKVRRLVRMASMVGYDVNDPPNGIGLPTVAQGEDNSYKIGNKRAKKFGGLEPSEKKTVAFAIMNAVAAQWHSGHHAIKFENASDPVDPDDLAEEGNDTKKGHEVASYDQTVIKMLLNLLSYWVEEQWCKKTDDKSHDLKEDLNQISDKIKDHLNKFSGGQQEAVNSSPFFVSRLAYQYAHEHPGRTDDLSFDTPIIAKRERHSQKSQL